MTAAPYRAVLVGVRRRLDYSCSTAPAYLKVYADSRPELSGRVSVEILQRTSLDAPGAVAGDLAALRPDLAGFSCYVWNIEWVLQACAALRGFLPGVKIILGGPEAAPQAAKLLAERQELDYVCLGEGEAVFADLLDRLASGAPAEGLPGLAWRGPGGPELGPARPPIEDLDSIPSPLLAGLIPVGPGSFFVLETSRGCPKNCSFCDWQKGQRTRWYSEARVLAEAAWLLRRVPRFNVFYSDADIFADLPRAKRLLRGLGAMSRGRWCNYCFQTWVPRLDDETLSLLDMEQFKIAAGVESLNPAALAALHRPLVGENVDSALTRLRALAPRCRLEMQLVYGLPGDTPAGFRRSLEWALGQGPDFFFMPRALALPGADLGRDPARFGAAAEAVPPHRLLSSSGFPAEEVEAAEALVYRLGTLASEDLFRWSAARLAALTGRPLLEVWEQLFSALENRGGAGFEDFYAGQDSRTRAFYEAHRAWRDSRSLADWARLSSALASFVRRALRAAVRDGAWPVLRREFLLRRLWFLFEKAVLSAPFRRASLGLDRLLGSGLQRLKVGAYALLRRALAGGRA